MPNPHPRRRSRQPPSGQAPAREAELVAEKLVPGGEALARLKGKVVFIPGALPGERVRVRLEQERKDYARAEIAEILAPSPMRVKPPCALAGRCGGCDWQHLDYAEQLRQKRSLAADALRRIGGIDLPEPEIEAGEPWKYRNRVQLHRAPGGGLGFLARGSHEAIRASACPVAHPALAPLLADGPAPGRGGVAGAAGGGSREPRRLLAWGHGGPGGEERRLAEEGSPEAAREIVAHVLGKPLRFDLRCFFQSNLAMTERLVPWALEGLRGRLAMDLYCGVGLFGAFLADRFERIVAVEENPASLAHARRNIQGTGHAFLEGKLEDLVLRGSLPGSGEAGYGGDAERPDAVVVDPPRTGLDAGAREWLAGIRPPALVYVSCNPVTLARDLKGLLAAGYRLDALRLFDFYPQTAHVEAAARLSLP